MNSEMQKLWDIIDKIDSAADDALRGHVSANSILQYIRKTARRAMSEVARPDSDTDADDYDTRLWELKKAVDTQHQQMKADYTAFVRRYNRRVVFAVFTSMVGGYTLAVIRLQGSPLHVLSLLTMLSLGWTIYLYIRGRR